MTAFCWIYKKSRVLYTCLLEAGHSPFTVHIHILYFSSPFHFIVIRRVENTVKDVIMENYNDVSSCSSGINFQLFYSISFYLFVLCKRYTDMFTILEIMDFIVLFVHGDVI